MKKISASKATRIRKKIEAGKASDEEKAALDAYEATKKSPGRKPKKKPDPAQPEVDQSLLPPKSLVGERTGAPPPDPPPKVDVLGASKSKGSRGGKKGDWRDKYRSAETGREELCLAVAELYCAWLRSMNASILELGGKPALDDELVKDMMHPAAVMTADKLLPADLSLTPEILLCAGTSATSAKWLYYKLTREKADEETEKENAETQRAVDPDGHTTTDEKAAPKTPPKRGNSSPANGAAPSSPAKSSDDNDLIGPQP